MKKTIFMLLLLIAFFACNAQTNPKEQKKTVTSELQLYVTTIKEFSRTDNVKWQKSGTDSEACKLLMDDTYFEITKVGFNDMLNGGVSYDDSYGIPIGVNVVIVNLSEKRSATPEEIGDLMNWNRAKGFFWDNTMQCNRMLETYKIENIDLYQFEIKNNVSPQKVLSEFASSLSQNPEVIYLKKGDIGYAYIVLDGALIVYAENYSVNEIETYLYEGSMDRAYTKFAIPPRDIRLAYLEIPKMKEGKSGIIINFEGNNIVVKHIGEVL